MDKINPKRLAWGGAFLGLTAVVIILELFASFDDSDNTVPWTDYIVQYIPGEVTAVLIGGLCLWLPVHFGLRYYKQHKEAKQDDVE